MGVLRGARPEKGPGLRAATGLSADERSAGARWSLERAAVALGAVVLTTHLVQHVAEGIGRPAWFFALGVVGAAGLWATVALWPRGTEGQRTLVLVPLGLGLVWGGLVEHLLDAIDGGLTMTDATGVLAGLCGVALLALAIRRFAAGRPGRPGADSAGRRS